MQISPVSAISSLYATTTAPVEFEKYRMSAPYLPGGDSSVERALAHRPKGLSSVDTLAPASRSNKHLYGHATHAVEPARKDAIHDGLAKQIELERQRHHQLSPV